MTEHAASGSESGYAARLQIDYQDELDRVTTLFRLILIIPIAIVIGVLTAGGTNVYIDEAGEVFRTSTGGIVAGLFSATLLMLVFRQKYPKWWFDFALELERFGARVGAYLLVITDRYPSTDEEQNVHLDLDYPDAENDLNRWLPLVKWFLAIPHYIVLVFLIIGAFFVAIIGWFAVLFTGKYPRGLFDYLVGVGRWGLRVSAYAFLLITDEYPPFSLR